MKKIFVLLISIWVPIYLVIGLLASCGNTAEENTPPEKAARQTSQQVHEQVINRQAAHLHS